MWTGFGFFFFLILPTRRNSCSLVSSQKSAPGKGIFAGDLRLYLSKSDQRHIVIEDDWSTIMCANMIIYQCGNHCEAAELARSLLEESRNTTLKSLFIFYLFFFSTSRTWQDVERQGSNLSGAQLLSQMHSDSILNIWRLNWIQFYRNLNHINQKFALMSYISTRLTCNKPLHLAIENIHTVHMSTLLLILEGRCSMI